MPQQPPNSGPTPTSSAPTANPALRPSVKLASGSQFTPPEPQFPGKWTDVRTSWPLIIRADAPLGDVAPIVRQLQSIHADMTRDLQLPDPCETVEILILRDRRAYEQFLTTNLPHAPMRRALYVKNVGAGKPGVVLTYRHNELAEDLRHESTHAMLHASLESVPLWLDEGLAEYYEVPPEQRLYGNPHLLPVKLGTRFRLVASLSKLEQLRDMGQMGSTEYRNSWAWVHFMLHGGHTPRAELLNYIDLLANPSETEKPGDINSRLEAKIPDVKQQFATHFKNWKPGR